MDKNKDELFEILTECEKDEHSRWVAAFSHRDNDKTAILTAHLIVEQMLESMISTLVMRPGLLLEDKDFRFKVDIVYALGGIGEHELNCCRVLNSARNAIAHDLGPLPEKWKVELERVTRKTGSTGDWKKIKDKQPIKSLVVLLATVAHAWVHIRFNHNRIKMRRDHHERWLQICIKKMNENLDFLEDRHKETLNYEVDLELAKETWAQRK